MRKKTNLSCRYVAYLNCEPDDQSEVCVRCPNIDLLKEEV